MNFYPIYSTEIINNRRVAAEVRETPCRKNLSKEPLINGWLGTTNDWSEYALGEFETEDEAWAAIDAALARDGKHRDDLADVL